MVEGGTGGRAGGPRSKPDSTPTQGSKSARRRCTWRVATVGLLIALVVGGLSAQASWVAATTPPNKPPEIFVDAPGYVHVHGGELLVLVISASDPEGDQLVFNVNPLPEGSSFVPAGDVALNGQLQSADATLILQYSAGLWAPAPEQLAVADADLDGSVNAVDALLVLQTVAGLKLPFDRYYLVWPTALGQLVLSRLTFTVTDGESFDETSLRIEVSDLHPAVPSSVQATGISPTEIKLTWTDEATNEAGYFILGWETYSNGPILVERAISQPNLESFTHSGLSPGTYYSYRVHAFNYQGSGDIQRSGGAVTVTAMTLTEGVLE